MFLGILAILPPDDGPAIPDALLLDDTQMIVGESSVMFLSEFNRLFGSGISGNLSVPAPPQTVVELGASHQEIDE
jgi:hypothetical protein